MPQLYDRIGVTYAQQRRPDPRIAALILQALGDRAPVLNVGAGTGSYEPVDREVVAVEPSIEMIRQRRGRQVPVVRASAMQLPFGDDTFDAVLAILTIHHWPNAARGVAEVTRVARRRVVFLTCDPAAADFWLIADYFPAIRELDRNTMPPLDVFSGVSRTVRIVPVPIPHDCADGFLGAYWRRPHAYLDARVRGAISAFSKIPDVAGGVERLRNDLSDGTWDRRHGYLHRLSSLDLGYRLVVIDISS